MLRHRPWQQLHKAYSRQLPRRQPSSEAQQRVHLPPALASCSSRRTRALPWLRALAPVLLLSRCVPV